MRRIPSLPVGVAAGATLGLLAALVLAPSNRTSAAAAYLLAVGAIAVAALTRTILSAMPLRPSEFERALGPPARERRTLRELTRLENAVIHGTETYGDFRRRLHPLLRDLAADRLGARGIHLERDLEAAREVLGDDIWEIVRADVDPARFGGGLPRARLAAVVERLEAM
jgi:hypothetical protein